MSKTTMPIQPIQVKMGAVFSNGTHSVRVAKNAGLGAGLRLDQLPANGMVFAPWFRTEHELADFLNVGGHVQSAPFTPVLR